MRNAVLFGEFKIYPRGFLGAMQEPVLEKHTSGSSQRLQYDVAIFEPSTSKLVTANQAIETSFTQLIRQDQLVKDFDFRERNISAILQAFGTQDFEGWYMAQFKSPSFGDLHCRFLDDCLRFIMTGERQLSVQTWDALLDNSDTAIDETELSEAAQQFFWPKKLVSELRPGERSRSLVHVVHEWLARPNGFTDLLYSSHILFGIKQ